MEVQSYHPKSTRACEYAKAWQFYKWRGSIAFSEKLIDLSMFCVKTYRCRISRIRALYAEARRICTRGPPKGGWPGNNQYGARFKERRKTRGIAWCYTGCFSATKHVYGQLRCALTLSNNSSAQYLRRVSLYLRVHCRSNKSYQKTGARAAYAVS